MYRFALIILFLVGCAAPVGVTKVSPKESYQIANMNSLSDEGKVSNNTKAVLQRFNLSDLYDKNPQLAIGNLYQIALLDQRRDLLFALAETSYAYAESLAENGNSQKSSEQAKDLFLQSAVYAYFYLLGESNQPLPSPYDNQFREACEIYNRGLEQGFKDSNGDGLSLTGGIRKLAGGTLTITRETNELGWQLSNFEAFYSADAYDIYGFTVRNRTPGLGVPIIGVAHKTSEAPNGGAIPITAFLRITGNLSDF